MREIKSGTQLASRYTLVRRLGAGGGAETWLATDRLTKASVALKLLVDPNLPAATLRREWQLSIRLMHAHIVRVFEFHSDDEANFYTLQYIDGPDLGALAGAPFEDVLRPITLIADALRYAHEKDVVHRDIKAANVLLDANGAPYLIDFGVAARGDDDIGGGSPIAASPQQLDGEPPAPSDDVFALGGLIYELISGRSAYSSSDTLADIASKLPLPLTAADGSPLPRAVVDLVAAMLSKEAADRPGSATVVATLTAAGFRGAPAPGRYVSSVRGIGDEVIRSDSAGRRTTHIEAPRTAVGEPGRGLSGRVVGIAFAALLALLLAVIFLLPKTVTEDVAEPAAEPVAETAAPEPTEDEEETAPERDERVQLRENAERVLGQLLAKTRTLEGRAVTRWGGVPWRRGQEAYEAGDVAYIAREYDVAMDHYRAAIEHIDPLLEQVDVVFATTLSDAEGALDNGDTLEALRLYELAVAISSSHGPARRGLIRAQNLDAVLALTEQGLQRERDLELDAARRSFEQAIETDPEWHPAIAGLERVRAITLQMQFDQRMTEGLTALADADLRSARAAFRRAQELMPGSTEPADGLLQVQNAMRLNDISALERDAASLEASERWQEAVDIYASLLELDADLAFAKEGLARTNQMTALHQQLDDYINDPDSLSSPRNMQIGTQMVVNITRMPEIGPRLTSQRDELSRLLRRAATPLTVQLVSDNMTDVSIYQFGKLGTFESTEVSLRPGTYVVVGSRPGYRDVRVEFRVAPELAPSPVVVRCEEAI